MFELHDRDILLLFTKRYFDYDMIIFLILITYANNENNI